MRFHWSLRARTSGKFREGQGSSETSQTTRIINFKPAAETEGRNDDEPLKAGSNPLFKREREREGQRLTQICFLWCHIF